MSGLSNPTRRWLVMRALASLADRSYQDRAWLRREFDSPAEIDSFGMVLSTLYDDTLVLPEPVDVVGEILFEGEEVSLLSDLGTRLESLIDTHADSSDSAYLSDARWPEVVRLSATTLALMVRRGGISIEGPG